MSHQEGSRTRDLFLDAGPAPTEVTFKSAVGGKDSYDAGSPDAAHREHSTAREIAEARPHYRIPILAERAVAVFQRRKAAVTERVHRALAAACGDGLVLGLPDHLVEELVGVMAGSRSHLIQPGPFELGRLCLGEKRHRDGRARALHLAPGDDPEERLGCGGGVELDAPVGAHGRAPYSAGRSLGRHQRTLRLGMARFGRGQRGRGLVLFGEFELARVDPAHQILPMEGRPNPGLLDPSVRLRRMRTSRVVE